MIIVPAFQPALDFRQLNFLDDLLDVVSLGFIDRSFVRNKQLVLLFAMPCISSELISPPHSEFFGFFPLNSKCVGGFKAGFINLTAGSI